jgi:hypothetical protein
MTIMGALRPTVAVAVLLGTASCGSGAAGGVTGATSSPTASTVVPAAAEGLVLRVEYTGGFLTPPMLAGRLPIVSVYADGRMITEGPVAAIYPGPALPDVQVQTIEAGAVQDLVDRAVAAGVGETSDLGTPPVADATSTRFTVVTADGTFVREAYALWETPMEGSGLTAEQDAARAKLAALLSALTEETTEGSGTQAYEPDAIGAIVSPWADPGDGLPQHEVAWPGPALPGEPTGGPMDVSCVVAAGAQARAILDAAGAATAATPWVTPEGTRWSVTFRPLLPDESGCADLVAD